VSLISACGLISGVALALLLPAGVGALKGDASRELLTSLKRGLSGERSNYRAESASEDILAELLHSKQILPITKELSLANSAVKREPINLATFSSSALATSVEERVVSAPKPAKGLVKRVRSIINKHAPRNSDPDVLAEAIVNESAKQNYDPLFVAAVIKSESTFNTSARSNKGAQGLMQIMPSTGAWISSKHGYSRGKLTDPGHNLKLGISYLKHLESEYSGNRLFALVAYNWGPGHVDSATNGKKRIPKQCMTYALKILRDYKSWQSGVI
jgi:soluble lytic murein transglycosylase-like protein